MFFSVAGHREPAYSLPGPEVAAVPTPSCWIPCSRGSAAHNLEQILHAESFARAPLGDRNRKVSEP